VAQTIRGTPAFIAVVLGGRSQGLCGGSWNNNEDNARVSIRNNNRPNNRNNNIGFRVAASLHSFADQAGRLSPDCMPVVCSVAGQTSRHNWLTFCLASPSDLFEFETRLGMPNIKKPHRFQ
jgi:hypothetical protein